MKILCIIFSILLIFLTKFSLSQSQNCTLYDDRTGYHYDFTSLSNKSYSYDIDNRLYLFSICNTTSYCLESNSNVSVCYISDRKIHSIGLANDYQMYPINYKEGGSVEYKIKSDICPHGYVRTRIDMLCDKTKSTIEKIKDSLCYNTIVMKSPLACAVKKTPIARPSTRTRKPNKNDPIGCINGFYKFEHCRCLDGFIGYDCSVAYNETLYAEILTEEGYPTVYFFNSFNSWSLKAYTLDEIDKKNEIKRSFRLNQFDSLDDKNDSWTGSFLGITVNFNFTISKYPGWQSFGGNYLPVHSGSTVLDTKIKGYNLLSPTNKLVLNFKADDSKVSYGVDNQALLRKPNSILYTQNFKNIYYNNTLSKTNSYKFSTEQLSDIVNLNHTFTIPNGVNEVYLRTIQSGFVASPTNRYCNNRYKRC